jgi:hypothetical protein
MASEVAKRTSYTEAEIRLGLTEVALCSGNTRLAAGRLKDAGKPIPRSTLEQWARTRPEQYEEVVREILPRVNEVVAAECISVARLAADAEVETLKRYHEVLPQLPARDVPGALRNVSTTKGINIQRARELRGEPTVIRHEKQSATELWAEFTAMFPSVVGGEAIEIPAEIQAPD